MSDPDQAADLTALNVMGAWDFDAAVDRFARWGLRWMDIWGAIYGKSVADLDTDTAGRAASALQRAGLRAYCLSTRVFDDHVERGEEAFRTEHLATLDRVLEAAAVLRPRFVRLIAGKLTGAGAGRTMSRLRNEHPWVADVYRQAARRIVDAGFIPTLENEVHDCFLADPRDFVDFVDWVQPPDPFSVTWDIQNAWEMGVFPTIEGYRTLRPLIGYVHTKGGLAAADDPSRLRWSVGLDSASWPVVEILQAAVDDGVSPVICLNPSHGQWRVGYDYGAPGAFRPDVPFEQWDMSQVTERDLTFLRARIKGIR
ncbi:sugar phosphate isomerase/epimerase family protein [Streptomyces sp. NPDC059477]|uniref:sugar phosphate isomerase/epimerase family protein n=1 Tax=Streptomyces sp. NPDC059477 TaxID=3346847 RepID=UPI00369B10D2